jgi:hypothetical protein
MGNIIEGLPRSTLRDTARKLTFVLARLEYSECQQPRTFERTKVLQAERSMSVTEIGMPPEFSETSSFTTASLRPIGLIPTGYYRSLTRITASLPFDAITTN